MGRAKAAIPPFVTLASSISNEELAKRATQVNCGYITGDPSIVTFNTAIADL